MTYRVVITPTAVKERQQIDLSVRPRLDNALRQLRDEPRPSGVRKIVGSKNSWRMRIGDYRILYEINDQEALVTVWRIAHRRQAYRDVP